MSSLFPDCILGHVREKYKIQIPITRGVNRQQEVQPRVHDTYVREGGEADKQRSRQVKRTESGTRVFESPDPHLTAPSEWNG